MNEKTCGKCREVKPVEEFYKSNKTPSGLTSYCQPCSRSVKKASREKNPVSLETRREYVRRYKEKHPESFRRQWRNQQIKKYRLTADEYDQLLMDQDGCCAICRSEPTTKMLAVDHCHTTEKIRGLLCSKCNTAIGLLNDDIDLFYAAITYLQNHT